MWDCNGFPVLRLVAEWAYTEGDKATTSSTAGTDIWSKPGLIVPDGCNTLFVTIVAHGVTGTDGVSTTDAPALSLDCKLDISPSAGTRDCYAGKDGLHSLYPIKVLSDVVGASSVNTSNINIHYTWCAQVTPGTYDLAISMSSGLADAAVSLTDAYFYVDAAVVELSACVPAAVAAPPV